MSDGADADLCDFCKQGKLIKRTEEIAFHQWTDRGTVFCKVNIPMGICDMCGAKTWDESAESIIEEAVRQAREKLP